MGFYFHLSNPFKPPTPVKKMSLLLFCRMNGGKSEVGQFYAGRSLLVTGASGFMGKVLVEKLLYACPDIKQIFILMRPKRGKSVEARMDDMYKSPVSIVHETKLCQITY